MLGCGSTADEVAMPRIALLAGLFLMMSLAPARADYDDAIKAYEHGDYAAALRELRPLAQQGNLDAQAKLGEMYLQGKGVKQDYTTAMRWLKQAATEGDIAAAESSLGLIYYNGAGVKRLFLYRLQELGVPETLKLLEEYAALIQPGVEAADKWMRLNLTPPAQWRARVQEAGSLPNWPLLRPASVAVLPHRPAPRAAAH